MNRPRKGGHPPDEGFARGKRKKRRPGNSVHRHAQETANPVPVPAGKSAGDALTREASASDPAMPKSAHLSVRKQSRNETGATSAGKVADGNSARHDPAETRDGVASAGHSTRNQKGGRRRKRRRRDSAATPAEQYKAITRNVPAAIGASSEGKPVRDEAGSGGSGSARARRRKRRRNKTASAGLSAGEPARYMRAPAKAPPRPSFQPVKGRNGRAPMTGNGRSAYAALDLGTNNCRLLVAVPIEGERFRVIDAFSRIVRLGEGMSASGRLSDEAMSRALEALAVCAGKMATHDLAGFRLIATEACRRADNGEVFLERVFEQTGLRLEVVDRQTEARLAAEGCGSLMDRHADGAVLFDIGGGSTELVLIDRPAGRNRQNGGRISAHISAWTSLPTGVVTLSERHGGLHVTPEIFEDMVADVHEQLARFEGKSNLADIWHPARTHLLGTSGTVTTIAGVHLKLPRYDRRKVDGIWLNDGQVDTVITELVAMDYDARARNPCIGKERADLVLAGCAILQAIRLTWPSPRLRVADRGLREGILAELMHEAGEWAVLGGQRHHGKQRRPSGASDSSHRPGTS